VAVPLLQFHMHHKFAIVDARLLINGSFNWTRQAVLYNQENCVITDNLQLVRVVFSDLARYMLVRLQHMWPLPRSFAKRI
jgi:phosphatidylserine/phosphatidylglycerophosphate/cardiolipin synthase-like enzyme